MAAISCERGVIPPATRAFGVNPVIEPPVAVALTVPPFAKVATKPVHGEEDVGFIKP